MIVEELWSARDRAALHAFRAALVRDDLAGALFAVEGAKPGVIEYDRALLLHWSREVAALLPKEAEPAVQAATLTTVLVGAHDLRGSADAFRHAWSSHLHQVLHRRRGLPILLSAIWMEVGRLAGIDVAGIGLPGHFLVRIGGRAGRYVDPYGGGRQLSAEECRAIVRRIAGGDPDEEAACLEPRSLRQMVERVLNNLVRHYEERQGWVPLFRTLTFLAAVRQDSPAPLLQRAEVAVRLGALHWAEADLGAVLERFPGTDEASAAAARLASLGAALLH